MPYKINKDSALPQAFRQTANYFEVDISKWVKNKYILFD